MRDPAKLLDGEATPAELMLLRAGASEEPSAQAVERLANALGLASGAALGAAVTKSAGAGSVVRSALSKLAGKWVVVGVLGTLSGAAVILSRAAVRPDGHESARGPRSSLVEAHASPSPSATGEGEGEHPQLEGAGSSVPADPNRRALAPNEVSPSAAPEQRFTIGPRASSGAASPSIAKEIAALDVARRALSSGNATGALAALNEYDKAGTSGMLRQEATLLRIEALVAAGNTAEARRLASRFLLAHPHSPHEKRIRALVGETP